MINWLKEKFRREPKIWLTSDLHFSHKSVINYCNRPFKDVTEMNAHIIKLWNKTVKPFDTIYVLGDFSLNPKWSKLLVPQLNGIKKLISGNHDACHISHKKSKNMVERYLRDGWDQVIPDYLEITLKNSQKVLLCHLPYTPTDPLYDVRYLSFRPDFYQPGILLHGHMHGIFKKANNMIDVGYDAHGGKILSEDDVIKLINDKRDFIPSPLTEYYKENKEKLIIKKNNEITQVSQTKVDKKV